MMTLLQLPALAPGQRIVASTKGETQLSYSLSTSPSVLTVSPPDGVGPNALLTLVAVNTGQAAVDISSITLAVPCGAGEGGSDEGTTLIDVGSVDLCNPTELTSGWAFTLTSPPPSGDSMAVFTLQTDSNYGVVNPGEVVAAQLSLEVNTTPGAAALQITETGYDTNTNQQQPPVSIDFAVVKYPLGFYFDNLTVNILEGAALTPVPQVGLGDTVILAWNGSDTTPQHYTVYWSGPDGGGSAVLTDSASRWSSPALTVDTVFTVVLSTTDDNSSVPASLSAAVAVMAPDLVVDSLWVMDFGGYGGSQGGSIQAVSVTTSGSVTATGVVADDLWAGAVHVTGPLNGETAVFTGEAQLAGGARFGGSVTMMSSPQPIGYATYSCSTDCILVIYVGPNESSGLIADLYYVYGQVESYPQRGYSNGLGNQIWVTGGTFDLFDIPAPQDGCGTLPVPANTPFTIGFATPDNNPPANASIVVIPLGAGTITTQSTSAEANAAAQAEGRRRLERLEQARRPRPADAGAVLDSLAAALAGPDGAQFKARLAAILHAADA